uniref:CTD18 n=1 Tax=Heliconius melpomene TaxID=34740 RepID=A0A2H4RMR6_HELME|nr:CTD18 [Heliconius melpomene]
MKSGLEKVIVFDNWKRLSQWLDHGWQTSQILSQAKVDPKKFLVSVWWTSAGVIHYTRDYLERTIIITKGSVERAKIKLDRICTYRTLYPIFFGVRDMRNCESLSYIKGAFLPKLTKEHYRTFMIKTTAKTYPSGFMEMYQYFFRVRFFIILQVGLSKQCEYIQAHDYCNGLILFLDVNEANIMETLKAYNISELRQLLLIIKEGYAMRLKGVHLLSESKAIDAIVALFKQVVSAKIASRIVVHKTIDTFYEYVPKESLPTKYGGNEKSLTELHDQFQEILSGKEFLEYLAELNKANTNEDLRVLTDDDEALGVPGTFRALAVD